MNYLKQILLGTSLVALANCSASSGTEYTYNGKRYVIVNSSAVSLGDSVTRVIVRKSSCNWVSTNVTAEIITKYGNYVRRLDSTKIKRFDAECTYSQDGEVKDVPPVITIPTVELEGVPPEESNQGE